MNTQLSVLPTGKTVVFYSPIEGQDVLVRTGTIGEGSPFLHALLHAYSKEYIKLDKKGKMKLAAKLRNNMAEKLDKKRWGEVSSSMVAKMPFQENISEILGDFYKHVLKNRSCKTTAGKNIVRLLKPDMETYKIICEIITLDQFEKEILPKAYDMCTEEKLEKCREVITQESTSFAQKSLDSLGDSIDKQRKKYCIGKLVNLMEAVLKEAESKAYKKYLENLKDSSVVVDSYTVELLSKRFNRNIYFMDSRTRMPYDIGSAKSDPKTSPTKSLIVMWLGGSHYETVGKLLPHNRIQREFYADDPLIRRINTFLYQPSLVAEQYPNLVPYLKKQATSQNEDGKSSAAHSSDSESDSRSRDRSRSDSETSSESDESSSRASSPASSHSNSRRRSRKRHNK
jgi:hypothetical protein